MTVDRRSFIIGSGSAAIASLAAFPSFAARAKHDAAYDFDTLIDRIGWAPEQKDAFFFVQATDLHSNETDRGGLKMPHKYEGSCFVDDIAALKPKSPAFALFTGDLISHVEMAPSTWSRAEQAWRRYKSLITDRVPFEWHQVLGNNDCASEPYRKVYPERPLYWSFERGRVLFVGLHGYSLWQRQHNNHCGTAYDEPQLAWLRIVLAQSMARTLVLVTHEPLTCNTCHIVRRQLAPVVGLFRGEEIWNVCGHIHLNRDRTWRLGGRTIHEVQTMTPVGLAFKVGDGGYRVFFCRDGKIVSYPLRWLDKDGHPYGFALNGTPSELDEGDLPERSFPPEALAVRLFGRDPIEVGERVRAQDRLTHYYISHPKSNCSGQAPGGLVWSVPTSVNGRRVTQVCLACARLVGQYGVSEDGVHFVMRPFDWGKAHLGAKTIPLPETKADKLWIKLVNETPTEECSVFGFALMP